MSLINAYIHLRRLLLLTLAFSYATCSFANDTKPNVLFITVDDLNDWIEPLGGHPDAKTPKISRFAESGTLVFRNAVCPAPVCGPSRSAFLSGYMPHRTGVYDNGTNMLGAKLVQDNPTLPEYFGLHGYHTLSTGKIFHSHKTKNGADKGQWAFENYFESKLWDKVDPEHDTSSKDNLIDGKTPDPLSFDGSSNKGLAWGPTADPDFEDTQDYAKVEWANQYLDGSQPLKEPFFMAVGIYKPHQPWYVPQEFFDLFSLDEISVPHMDSNDLDDILKPDGSKLFSPTSDYNWVKTYNLYKEATRAYLAAMNEADRSLGVILDQLAASEYADNTIVVIMGDHGWHLGEKLRYHKNTLWAESVKTPLIVRTPETQSNYDGLQYSDSHVNLIDVFPTLIDLCGLPQKGDLDGKSFSSILSDPTSDDCRVGLTVSSRGASVLSKRWHLIENRNKDNTRVFGGEFYDLVSDPYETNNLIDSDDAVVIAAISTLSQHLPQEYEPSVMSKPGKGPKALDRTIKPLRQKLGLQ